MLRHYSSRVLADSFSFCESLHQYDKSCDGSFMCSFDVKNLFTNVPVDETIDICMNTLYRTKEIEKPMIEEKLLKKLLLKCTRGVEFSFNNNMYRQVDGVAMGSPLGPILANIFLGYCECQIPKDQWPELYGRYVDDTFSLFIGGRDKALQFLDCLNSLHPSLQFTMESESDGKLPFLDVLVMRNDGQLRTTIYRKPTFTGLYVRWDSYCSPDRKISLIRSLTIRAKRICSPEHLDNELSRLKVILLSNGYPAGIVERVIDDTLRLKPPVLSARLKPVYLRLPWLGTTSSAFKNRLETLTRKTVPWCRLFCIFTSRVMFNTNRKDVLTAENLSNVVYLFSCECDHSYVGKTTLRLSERVNQHIPAALVTEPKKRGRPRKIQADTRAEVQVSTEPELEPVASRTRSKARGDSQIANATSKDPTAPTKAPDVVIAKTDSAITRHLKTSPGCLSAIRVNFRSRFSVLARGRNASHLRALEAIFIARKKPELCSQKDYKKTLAVVR